jgi:flagellar biosynthesis protein FliQ
MTTESLVTVTTVAVAIAAIAIVGMAIMVFSMFKAVTTIRDQVQLFLPKAEGLVTAATRMIAENQQELRAIVCRTNEIVETAHKDVTRLDAFVEDTTTRAKVQLERLELVMDDTVERVHHTVVMLNNTVLKPVREVSGVASGVKAAVKHLMRANRPTPAQATSDEEMFI